MNKFLYRVFEGIIVGIPVKLIIEYIFKCFYGGVDKMIDTSYGSWLMSAMCGGLGVVILEWSGINKKLFGNEKIIKENIKNYKGNDSLKNYLVQKVLVDLDNLFSEDFIRKMYYENGYQSFYRKYQDLVKNTMTESFALFPKKSKLNILLKNLNDELKAIKSDDILSTIFSSNINIITDLQNKFKNEFRNVKQEFIQGYFKH